MADYSPRHVLSYSVGLYLGVNALRDAYLLLDGPDCAFMRTQYVQGNHDYLSSLTSVGGFHRVVHSALDPLNVAGGREAQLTAILDKMVAEPGVGCALLSSLSMASVLGTDYGRLCRDVEARCAKDVIYIRGNSLSDDWLGGYAATLEALAKKVPLDQGERDARTVAVVGLLFDRNEEDCRGNVRELERLLRGLGLEPASVWLAGQRYAELSRAGGAGTVISLPYGRKAARTLARRLDADLVELELPFGLPATERFVRQLAAHFDERQRGEALIDGALRQIVPKLEWVVPFLFEGKRFGYVGDPHLLPGFAETVELCGAELAFAVVTCFEHHLNPDAVQALALPADKLLVEPRADGIVELLTAQIGDGRIDCLVANGTCSDIAEPRSHAVVELGFPAYNTHALYDRPYLGFAGVLAFADTVANTIRQSEAYRDVIWRPDRERKDQ